VIEASPTHFPSRGWNGFFFSAADPRPLASFRVVVGLLSLWNWVWIGADLGTFFGPDGWADPDVARAVLPPGGWSLWFWVPNSLTYATWVLGLLVFVALTVGFASRTSAWLAWAFSVSTLRRVPVMLFGFDNVIVIWTLYLAISHSAGQAYSVDRMIKRLRQRSAAIEIQPAIGANLGLRLIQIHLCLIYASAGLAKLQGPSWWNGRAVGLLIGNSEFRPFDLSFLADHPMLIQLSTHLTVALELLYPVLIWQRRLRPWLLVGAVLMHAAIALTMGLTEFSIAMLAGSLAFVPGLWFERLARFFGRRIAPAAVESNVPRQATRAVVDRRGPKRSRP
jgi:hypothetical protein